MNPLKGRKKETHNVELTTYFPNKRSRYDQMTNHPNMLNQMNDLNKEYYQPHPVMKDDIRIYPRY